MELRNFGRSTVASTSGNPFDTLTTEQRGELYRVLSWVLASTQCEETKRQTILQAMALLESEGPISPDEIDEV